MCVYVYMYVCMYVSVAYPGAKGTMAPLAFKQFS